MWSTPNYCRFSKDWIIVTQLCFLDFIKLDLKHVYRFILTLHDHNAIAGYQATSIGSIMQLVWIHQWSRPTQLHLHGTLISFSLRSQTYQSSCIVLERLHWTETAQPSLLFLGNHMTSLVGFVLGCGRDLAHAAGRKSVPWFLSHLSQPGHPSLLSSLSRFSAENKQRRTSA